ncbi:hypothetical protein ASF10_11095 [Flavobacterium sp. Leaf82]|uniref:hypothetical protein n=1 Tax=unclassified Flavobacterium TaxID=196869 RepID=UPI0006FA64A7|nr:hypothetical protein [Flavobacterium sp. Leaf82]KQO22892.1 hypothetical protein ASF10_11095 [Flavobacterium sp. Leaf82]
MKPSINEIQAVLTKKGYAFFDQNKPYNLNIIGIRSKNTIANSFDDTLCLVFRDESLNHQIFTFAATTDPGLFWLKNPLNVSGTAILVPGQYKGSHQVGLHKGQYEALVQKAPVKVWRDANKDGVLDFSGTQHEGIFGINIHRSNPDSESQTVEKWSAGCTVFKKVADFKFFMGICNRSKNLYGNSFTYTLLEEADFITN